MPPEKSAHIVSDNEPSVTVIPTFATRTRRKQMQLQYHNLFRITAFLISARSSILEWVRAHIGNVPNEVADCMAKHAATKEEGVNNDPLGLQIQALYDLCKLPITIYTSKVAIVSLKPKLNMTTCRPEVPKLEEIFGSYSVHLKKHFAETETTAFNMSSYRSQATKDLDPTTDITLWHSALQGRALDPTHRRIDAHILKLATHMHTSLASLDKTNPHWKTHHVKHEPPPRVTASYPVPASEREKDYLTAFKSHSQRCPACLQRINSPHRSYHNTMYHMLNECSNKEIAKARETAVFNLGDRLPQIGPPEWWKDTDQTPHSPPIEHFENNMKEPAATIWRELTSRTTLEDEPLPAMTSIPIPRSQNTPGALGANYLYTWLSSPSRITNPTSPIDLPLLSKKRLGAHILHPAIIEAAVLTYQTSTEVLATPRLLICLRTYNITTRRKVTRNFPHYYTNQSQPK